MKMFLSYPVLFVSLAAIGCAVGLQVGSNIPLLRLVLALLLLLILPGFALTLAIFLKPAFGTIERVLIVVSSSILIAILAGVILNWTAWGLNASSWTVVLCGFTLTCCLVAGLRRIKAGNPSFLPGNDSLPSVQTKGILERIGGGGLVLLFAVLVATGAISLAQTPITNPANLQGYTLLWVLPGGNDAPGTVNFGVVNDQFTTGGYDLKVLINNQVVQEWPDIRLAPGEKWESVFEIPGQRSGSTPVEAFLYKLDHPDTIYRQVKLLIGP